MHTLDAAHAICRFAQASLSYLKHCLPCSSKVMEWPIIKTIRTGDETCDEPILFGHAACLVVCSRHDANSQHRAGAACQHGGWRDHGPRQQWRIGRSGKRNALRSVQRAWLVDDDAAGTAGL